MILADSSEAPLASPVCHVGASSPFMLLAHARHDLQRILDGSRTMASALERNGVAHEVLELEGDHFSAALDVAEPGSPWTQRVIRFLNP
jgi:hypothetical protein